jgi:hypothetical protein
LANIWSEIEASGLKNYQYPGWIYRFSAGGKPREEALHEIEMVRPFFPRIYELVEKETFAWPPLTPGAVDRMVQGARTTSLIMNEARVEARKGNFAEIERAFRANRRMSEFLARSGHLRGIGLAMGMKRNMAEALTAMALDPEVPPLLVERLSVMVTMPEFDWRRSLRYMGMAPGELQPISSKDKPKLRADDLGSVTKAYDWETFWRSPAKASERAARSRQLHYFTQAWPLLDMPDRALARSMESPITWTKPPELPWPSEKLTVQWIPNYVSHSLDERGRLAASVAGARLYATLRRTGRLPAKLGPEMPVDPWTGRALRYEVVGSEFFLWSAGRSETTTRPTAGFRLFDSAKTRKNVEAMMAKL